MKINIEPVGIELTEPLQVYIEGKMNSLAKFVKHFEADGELEFRIEIFRTTKHHKKGGVYRAVIDLPVPKKVLRAEEFADDIRTAVTRAKDVMKMEIEKYKEKQDPKGKSQKAKVKGRSLEATNS